MTRSIHPFPARMAPGLALSQLTLVPPLSLVVDPMAGSGTVLRQASELGLRAIGYDIDPLAVLIARVWTTPVDTGAVMRLGEEVLSARAASREPELPWIDTDEETRLFVEYWFDGPQRHALGLISERLALLQKAGDRPEADVLRVALSRIIVTKDRGASLGRDISHSRPHRVADRSDFDVWAAFAGSIRSLVRTLDESPPRGNVTVALGDARSMPAVLRRSADIVLTSPPYLNAIDYIRGHRLALVWLGYSVSQLRGIRATSIGAERAADRSDDRATTIAAAMGDLKDLSPRNRGIVARYAGDLDQLMGEIRRILKDDGRAILVVGNSCLRGTFVRNSEGVRAAGQLVGLHLVDEVGRDLPPSRRYLPIPEATNAPLGKRMRTESILTFAIG
jgi:SAM-dependent methyltransferase